MFGSWFAKNHQNQQENDGLPPHESPNQAPFQPSSSKPLDVLTPRPTPHDEILRNIVQDDDLFPSTSAAGKQKATPERGDSQRSSLDVRPPKPEALFDPFTGHIIGSLAPSAADQESYFSGMSTITDHTSPFDEARDKLWTNISKVRELQAAVAEAHVQMEGAALGERAGGRAGSRRMSSTVGGHGVRRASASGAEWDDEVYDEDSEHNREREEEFARMPGRFASRTETVDSIMAKLDELGKALTSFHSMSSPPHGHPSSEPTKTDTSFQFGTFSPMPLSTTRFAAPGPRFDSSPAIPKRVLTPDRPERQGSPLRESSMAMGPSSLKAPGLLIMEDTRGKHH